MTMSLTRNLEKAREAYEKKDSTEPQKVLSPRSEESRSNVGAQLKSAVYGGLDGIITTFAVVAGVAGANLQAGIVLILGFANLIGDGISMAVGDYLSTKSEQEYHQKERAREEWEAEHNIEDEKQEMIETYTKKGMHPEDAIATVSCLAKHKQTFVDVMMVEKLGMLESKENPLKSAAITFGSFILFGFIPLLVYVLALIVGITMNMFVIATVLTGITLFVLGSLRSYFTGKNWFVSGLEMLIVGGIAAGAAYLIGFALQGLA